jgi:hypothetical protein
MSHAPPYLDVFRAVQASFEVIRELYDKRLVDSFVSDGDHSTTEAYSEKERAFATSETPSWEYYANASDEPVPIYRVELAKSGRSACKMAGKTRGCSTDCKLIPKDEIRIGSIDEESGTYTRWLVGWLVSYTLKQAYACFISVGII